MEKTLKPDRLEMLIRDIRDVCFSRGNPPWVKLVDVCADLRLIRRWRTGRFSLDPYDLANYLRQFYLHPETRPDAAGVSRGGYRFELLGTLFLSFVAGPPKRVNVTGVKR